MNENDNCIHKYYAPFFGQTTMNMYLLYQNMIQKNKHFVVIKNYFGLIILQENILTYVSDL